MLPADILILYVALVMYIIDYTPAVNPGVVSSTSVIEHEFDELPSIKDGSLYVMLPIDFWFAHPSSAVVDCRRASESVALNTFSPTVAVLPFRNG